MMKRGISHNHSKLLVTLEKKIHHKIQFFLNLSHRASCNTNSLKIGFNIQ